MEKGVKLPKEKSEDEDKSLLSNPNQENEKLRAEV